MPPAVRSRRLRSAGMSDTSTVNEVDPARGLSAADVAARVAEGRTNDVPAATTRTVAQIVRANVFTRFNAILGAMLAIIVVVGPVQDALFGIVLVANALHRHRAGAPRQAHARPAHAAHRAEGPRRPRRRGPRGRGRATSCSTTCSRRRPARRSWSTARSLTSRGPRGRRVAAHRRGRPGRQAAGRRGAVGVVRGGGHRAVPRGEGRAPRPTRRRLAEDARRFTVTRSELRSGINTILTYVTCAIVPTAALLFFSQLRAHDSWRRGGVRRGGRHRGDGARGPRAADLARVRRRRGPPRAAAGARAGAAGGRGTRARRRGVRRQDRHAHRGAGSRSSGSTRSTGPMRTPLERALAALAAARRLARTRRCARSPSGYPDAPAGWRVTDAVPFSSARKWSGIAFDGQGAWVLGAPDVLLDGRSTGHDDVLRGGRRRGRPGPPGRAARPDADALDDEQLPATLAPVALVVLGDIAAARRRRHAALLRRAGRDREGDLGRQPAHRRRDRRRGSGSTGADEPLDARELPEDGDELAEARRAALGVRPGHAAAEARDGARRCRAAGTRSR